MPLLKIWDGSTWIEPSGWNRPKIWDGSTWAPALPRVWNGSSWYNLYSVPQSRTITVGNSNTVTKFGSQNIWGYAIGAAMGNCTPQDLFLWQNAYVSELYYDVILNSLFFTVFSDETYITNGNWTTLNVNGTNFSRASATFSTTLSGNYATGTWQWTNVQTDPFPESVGATVTATWT